MNDKTKMLTLSALMCAIIILSTLWFKFSIPGTEILFTTQVFFILLCGQLLPVRYCFYTIGTYIMLGMVGIPVFSSTVGPAVLATPSFGYLLGFPFSAAAVAVICRRFPRLKGRRYIASIVGTAVNYIIALAYIACLKSFYLETPIPLPALLSAYCFAFLPMDIIKGILAALAGQRLEKPLKLYQPMEG